LVIPLQPGIDGRKASTIQARQDRASAEPTQGGGGTTPER